MSKFRQGSVYNLTKIGSGLGESQVMIRLRFRLKSGNDLTKTAPDSGSKQLTIWLRIVSIGLKPDSNLAKIGTGFRKTKVMIKPRLDQNQIWPRPCQDWTRIMSQSGQYWEWSRFESGYYQARIRLQSSQDWFQAWERVRLWSSQDSG